MSLTLLSECVDSRLQKQLAAARTAEGADDSDVSVTAHSYMTAGEGDCSSSRMVLMNLPFSEGLVRQACGGAGIGTAEERK